MPVRTVLAALVLVSAAAAAQSREINTRDPFYLALMDFGVDWALAETMAANCSGLEFRRDDAKAEGVALHKQFEARGYTAEDSKRAGQLMQTDKALNDRFARYIRANGITMSDKNSFCDPGRREIAAGSRIGRFLKAR